MADADDAATALLELADGRRGCLSTATVAQSPHSCTLPTPSNPLLCLLQAALAMSPVVVQFQGLTKVGPGGDFGRCCRAHAVVSAAKLGGLASGTNQTTPGSILASPALHAAPNMSGEMVQPQDLTIPGSGSDSRRGCCAHVVASAAQSGGTASGTHPAAPGSILASPTCHAAMRLLDTLSHATPHTRMPCTLHNSRFATPPSSPLSTPAPHLDCTRTPLQLSDPPVLHTAAHAHHTELHTAPTSGSDHTPPHFPDIPSISLSSLGAPPLSLPTIPLSSRHSALPAHAGMPYYTHLHVLSPARMPVHTHAHARAHAHVQTCRFERGQLSRLACEARIPAGVRSSSATVEHVGDHCTWQNYIHTFFEKSSV